jgi:hypothetical protein
MAALKLPRSLHLLQGLILLLESKVHSGRPYWPRSAGVAVLAVRIDVPLTRADHSLGLASGATAEPAAQGARP